MYKQLFSFLMAIFLLQSTQAQSIDSAGILVHKSSRLDEMMKKNFIGATTASKKSGLATGSSLKSTNYRIKRSGYRVLVLNTNDRNLIYKTKGQLLGRYPQYQLYTAYQAPFYKLKMGDFASRKEAEKLRDELIKIFSKGVFIIHETVLVKHEVEGV